MGEKGCKGGDKRFVSEQKSEGSKDDVLKKKLINLLRNGMIVRLNGLK